MALRRPNAGMILPSLDQTHPGDMGQGIQQMPAQYANMEADEVDDDEQDQVPNNQREMTPVVNNDDQDAEAPAAHKPPGTEGIIPDTAVLEEEAKVNDV